MNFSVIKKLILCAGLKLYFVTDPLADLGTANDLFCYRVAATIYLF